MKDKRLVNIRILFCLFVGLMVGIVVGRFFLAGNLNILTFVFLIVGCVALSSAGVVYSLKLKKNDVGTRYRKNVSSQLMISSIGVFVAFFIGITLMVFPMQQIVNLSDYENEMIISGEVCDYVDNEDTYKKFILKNIVFIDGEEEFFIDGKILVYSSTYIDVKLGDKISFSGTIQKMDRNNLIEFNCLSAGINYSTYMSSTISKENGKIGLSDVIKNHVETILDKNLNEDNADISYSILFGDKYGLSQDIKDMFSYAGISHILAVSGLHIGVLVSILWFALDKVKLNRYAKLIIFASFLTFYTYLCSFSPSVCRASIMAIVLALCKLFFLEYDSISSLSIAGILILLFSPMSLFSVSFQLSFLCIFAIIAFAPAVRRIFDKMKMPKVLAEALAISIAVNLIILPICLNVFAQVSLLGILSNLVVLPIFTILYVLLFGFVVVSCIMPFLGFMLQIPNMFLHLIKVVAEVVSLVPLGVFKAFNVGYWILVLFILMTLVVHYLMTKHILKLFIESVLSLCIIIMLVISGCPKSYSDSSLVLSKQNSTNICVYVENGQNILIGSNIKKYNIMKIMKNLKIKTIDTIVAYDLQLNELDELNQIIDFYNTETVYISSLFDYENLINSIDTNVIVDNDITFNNCEMRIINYDGNSIGITIDGKFGSVLLANSCNKKDQNIWLKNNHFNVDYAVLNNREFWADIEKNNIEILYFENILECVVI